MTIQQLNLNIHSPSFFLTNPLDQITTTRKVIGIAIFILLTLATAGIYAGAVLLRNRVTLPPPNSPGALSSAAPVPPPEPEPSVIARPAPELPPPVTGSPNILPAASPPSEDASLLLSSITAGDIWTSNVEVPVAQVCSPTPLLPGLRITAADGREVPSDRNYAENYAGAYDERLYLDGTTTNILNIVDEAFMHFYPRARPGRVPLTHLSPLWNAIPGHERAAYTILIYRMLSDTADGLSERPEIAGSVVLFVARLIIALLQAPRPPIRDSNGAVITIDPAYEGSLRDIVSAIAGASAATCGDNVTMSMDDAHLAWLLYAFCQIDLTPEELLLLVVAKRRREILHTKAAAFMRNLSGDGLERELLLRQVLNRPLSLQLLSSENLYADGVMMRPSEIIPIGNTILSTTTTHEDRLHIFYHSAAVQWRLRQRFPDRFTAVERAFDEDPENDTSPMRNETDNAFRLRVRGIEDARTRLLAALTRQITEELGQVPPVPV